MRRVLPLLGALLTVTAQHQGAEQDAQFRGSGASVQSDARFALRAILQSIFEGANRQWPNRSPVVLVERDAQSAPYQYLMSHRAEHHARGI